MEQGKGIMMTGFWIGFRDKLWGKDVAEAITL
jgi:hypothetical protein